MPLSIERHATSKLRNDNLFEIKTLGFRGEALPSIAAVSNLKIMTKSYQEKVGSEIFVNEGKIEYKKPSSINCGTNVLVKDIFFSTPARLKFLKSDKYEFFLIKKVLQKLAVSNPKVEFNFFNNEKQIFSSKSQNEGNFLENIKLRVRELFGSEFSNNLINLNQVRENFRFVGLIGLPTFNFSNNSNQFICINNRIVNDRLISSSIKTAYRDFMFHDRFPQVVIFITCPHSEVDVNVHPKKNEVRFKNPSDLRTNLINSIRDTLSSSGHRSSSVNTTRAIRSFSSKKEFIDFQRINKYKTGLNDIPENEFDIKVNEKNKLLNNSSESFVNGNFLGSARSQLHNTYIISETPDGIIIIDQHAAHERIVYERLKKEFYQNSILKQILLIPEIIECENAVLENVLNYQSALKKYGILIEKFGNDSILVREIPIILIGCKIKQLIFDVIQELSNLDDSELIETQINKVCSSMACHGSIRAGRQMKVEEMEKLLREMEDTEFSGQCNHGRPTYVKLKLTDIEKLFGRK